MFQTVHTYIYMNLLVCRYMWIMFALHICSMAAHKTPKYINTYIKKKEEIIETFKLCKNFGNNLIVNINIYQSIMLNEMNIDAIAPTQIHIQTLTHLHKK